MHALKTFSIIFLCWGGVAYGRGFSPDNYRDIRWLGRGNTGVATLRDGTAVFYNPANIGEIETFGIEPINATFGGNQNIVTGVSEVFSLTSGNTSLSEKFEPFLGKPIGAQGNVFPHVAIPGFVFGFYDSLESYISYRDPVYPLIEIEFRNDYGYALGYGSRVKNIPGLYLGGAVRYVKRRHLYETLRADAIVSYTTAYLAQIQKVGEAWAANLGAKYRYELDKVQSLHFGAAVEDAGYAGFRAPLGGLSPAVQKMKIHYGFGYKVDTSVSTIQALLDVRDYHNPNLNLSKKIFAGLDLDLPLIDVRGGFYQGYWTLGLSFSVLPFIQMDLATYAEELDYFAGLRQSRIWMVGIRTGFDIDGSVTTGKGGTKRKQKYRLEDI